MIKDPKYPISGHTDIDDAADRLKPFTYRYKSPTSEPRSHPNGGMYAGVIAQNLETHPLTNQAVQKTPQGLTLEGGPLMSLLSATAGRAHDRLNAHEQSIAGLTGLLRTHQKALSQHSQMLHALHKVLSQKLR